MNIRIQGFSRGFLAALAVAGSLVMGISSASAQTTVNWDGDTSATWGTAANWDTAPGNSTTTNIANFNLATYGGNPVFAPNAGTTSIAGITVGSSNGEMTLTTTNLTIGGSGISIANGAGAFTISGTTTLGGNQSWANDSTNLFTFGAVTAGANTLTVGGSGSTTATGIIAGTNGALTKNGTGLLTLNAANTYTGTTTVNGGEIRWGIANAIAGGPLNINDGGTVNIQSFSDTVGTITIAKGGNMTGTTGVLSTGLVVSNDGGTFSGFSAGFGLRLTGGITYNSTGPGSTTLQIDRIFIPDQSVTVFDVANGDAAIDFEITETLSGGGNNISRTIRKTGPGVMQFSGSAANTTSTNQMPLDIREGTVIFNKSAQVNAIPNSAITIGDGIGSAGSVVLQFRTSSNQIENSPITINSDGLFDLNGLNETTSGALTMNGGSLTTGAGTLTLGNAANTIRDASTVTGSLTLSGTAATNLTLGGTASINGATTFSGGNGAGITATGNTSIGGTLAFGSSTRTIAVTSASDTLTITANITGNGAITKAGVGTLRIGDGTTAGSMSSASALTMGGGTLAILAPTTGSSSQTVASLATTASTGSTIRLTPGASGTTTLTITSATLSTGAGSSLNFDYTAGTTVGGTVGNNYVVWNPTLTGGIIGGAYTVTDSGGTGFATKNGTSIVRLTDSGSAGLPVSTGSAAGSYFVASGYSTVSPTTPGSLVQAISGAVAANNVTVNTTGLASGANLALDTNLLTLGAGMVFDGPNPYEITGSGAGGLRAASAGGTINLYNANTSTVTISAPIVNNTASRLTVDGPGTTILSGNNTYTGATVVNGGTVRFSGTMAASAVTINNNAVAQIGAATGLTSSNSVTFGAGASGSLQLLGNSVTIGALATNATAGTPVIANNSVSNVTLTVDSGSGSTFGGVIQDGTGAGSLALAKSGAGTLTLSGTNTYSGGTVINAGAVSVTSDANLGDAGGGVTLNGGRLTIPGANINTARNMTVTGTGSSMVVNKNNNFSTSGNLTGSGSLAFTNPGGSGTTSIYNFSSTANTFTGSMSLDLADVRVSSLGDTAGNNIVFTTTAGSSFSLNSSGVIAGLTFNNRAIELSNLSGTVNNNNGTHAMTIGSNLVATGAAAKVLTLGAASGPTNAFSGNITNGTGGGTVGITKSGTGRWMLSGSSNSYTGGTTVSAGTLIMTSPANLGNGALNVGANTFIYSPTTAGALNIGSGVLTLSGTIGTAVGGTASQSAITSTGTAVLSGTTGRVNIYGITGVAPTAGVNNLITAGGGLTGGTFVLGTVFNNSDFTVSAISRSATAISTTVTAATPISTAYWKGGLSGNTGVWAASTGLSGGTSNWQETVGLNQPLTPGAPADLIFSSATSPGTMAGMTLGANMAVKTLTVNDTATAFGLNNDGYSLTITPASSSSGITIASGVQASSIAASVVLGANQTWTNDSSNALTVSGNVRGTGFGITKSGTGTIVLSGTNTYTGATNVNAGTLNVTGAGSINTTSAITVASGARFANNSSVALALAPTLNGAGTGSRAVYGGTGTLNAALTLDNVGDVLSPGNSPGIQTFGVDQSWASNSYDWELNDWTASVAGTNIDQINITGNLTLTGATPGSYILNVLSLTSGNVTGDVPNFSDVDNSWTILTTTTGISGFNASYWTINTGNFTSTPTATGTWNIQQSGNNLILNYVAVPEPTTIALLASGVAIAGYLRSRRRRS
jgi:autotransporter-associated beta strand protein